ncbi:aldose epimerase family protein [Exiguobacterium aurantiacum]|uniref:Aldose 1-epimerase n=1 Tax=Exiguobacterium aurantiacum TaxID=33987 RepID=A0A377FS22_9BACL|nr:aldose epimerase family protein [Exiguobacterium aurantiacum]STO07265.1 Aldose 1-epimerase precursor [Exiguobacterium aurantiacum]
MKQATIENANGMRLSAIDYGCAMTELTAPDRDGNYESVILKYGDPKQYLENPVYLGSVVGRIAGRIRNAEIDGVALTPSEDPHHIHGGEEGITARHWDMDVDGQAIVFTYLSPDGEEGYPGNVRFKVMYELTDDDALVITMTADTDERTWVNLNHHNYFNLGGRPTVHDHVLTLPADHAARLDEESLPTGELLEVDATPFDFRAGKEVGAAITSEDEAIVKAGGLDHPFLLKEGVTRLHDPVSGRVMEVETNQPVMVVYTANFLSEETPVTLEGRQKHSAICLEAQAFPDAPNHPGVATSIELNPGELYYSRTVYKFSAE